MPDYQQKARAAGYFDQLLLNDPHKLMRKYSVCPTGSIDSYRGTNAATFAGVRDDNTDIVHRRMALNKKIAYVTLTRKPRGSVSITGNEGGDTVCLDGQYEYDANRVPIWYLPWDTVGSIIELTIPAKGTVRGPDPDIFFTAAINGCSVFFRGTQQNPTVYHAGGDTCKGTDHLAAATFWRDLMLNNVLNVPVAPPGMKEVNKTNYIKTPGYKNSTPAARRYEKWLKDHKSERVEVSMVNPWGCVMGIRNPAGNWTFYLQENVTIIYKVLAKKKHFWSKKKAEKEAQLDAVGQVILQPGTAVPVVVEKQRYVSRPLITREVFPNTATGGVYMSMPIPDVFHG